MTAVGVDSNGEIYVSDDAGLSKIDATGNVTTLAGNGTQGYADGAGSAAQFRGIVQFVFDAQNNIHLVDSGNNCIRKVDPAGNVTTVAGNGNGGPQLADGTGGPHGTARFRSPRGMTMNAAGYLFVVDSEAPLRQIDPSGNVTSPANGRAASRTERRREHPREQGPAFSVAGGQAPNRVDRGTEPSAISRAISLGRPFSRFGLRARLLSTSDSGPNAGEAN